MVELWPGLLCLAICDAEVMAEITQLTIHDLVWPRQPLDLPSAQRVTLLELVVYCPTPSYHDLEDAGTLVGIFSDDDESLCTLHCPALETLSFLSATRPELTVDVFDVLGVIERRLRFSAGLLACLRLRNVFLYDPTQGQGMALLTDRVRRIEYCAFRGQKVPFVHQKHDSMAWVYEMIG